MFIIRRLIRTRIPVRWTGDEFENVFKTYLQQAEEIERRAREKALEQKAQQLKSKEQVFNKLSSRYAEPSTIEEPSKTAESSKTAEAPAPKKSEVEIYIDNCEIINKLKGTLNPQDMQTLIEQQLLILNKNYYDTKNLDENVMTCSEFLMKLKEIYERTPEITIREISFASIIRSIWIRPISETSLDFGEFHRLVKDETAKHSPFIYGPLNEEIYLWLASGIGIEKVGVKLIKRILDHMSIHNHTPSLELAQCIIDECITGKWPNTLFSALKYFSVKELKFHHKVWVSIVNYFRFNKVYCFKYFEILDMAFKHGALPTFDIMQIYIKKSQNLADQKIVTSITKPITLLNKLKEQIDIEYPSTIQRSEKYSELVYKFCLYLISINEKRMAYDQMNSFLNEQNFSFDSIEVALKFHEELKDSFKAMKTHKAIVTHPQFVYTPKIVVAMLRMCSVFGEPFYGVVDEIIEQVLVDKKLCTPFAVNTIIVCCSVSMKWNELSDYLTKFMKIENAFNKYTAPTLKKFIMECDNPSMRSKIMEQVSLIENKVNKH